MAEHEAQVDSPQADDTADEEEFTPVASMVLLVGYIIIFAAAWGSIYFFDLLARR